MPTARDIQNLVNVAQQQILKGELDDWKKVTWPAIRSAINVYQDLNREGRMQLAGLIYGRLDALGLQAGEPVDINVMELTHLIQTREVEPRPQGSAPEWIP